MKKVFNLLIFFICLFLLTGCKKNNNPKLIDIKLTDEEYAFVIKKGNNKLKNDFNSFLNEIKEDGTFDMIISKYFLDSGTKNGFKITTQNITNNDSNFVVVTNCPFEPFEYIGDDGLAYGIDIEIAYEYAKSRNLNLVIKNIEFEAILNEVDTGYADIGMAGMTITQERLNVCDFTNTYFNASQKLVVSENNHLFDDCKTKEDVEEILRSLENKKIGYQIGTTGNWYVDGDDSFGFSGYNNLISTGYKTAQLAIQDIMNGLLYGVIVDEAPANSIINGLTKQNSKLETFLNAINEKAFQNLILTGLKNTLLIACIGLIIGIIVGTIIAIIKVAPKYKKIIKFLDKICNLYVAIFRGTPMVVQLLIAYYVILPILGINNIEALNVAIIVFGLNSASYVSEIMRGGLNSIDKGQLEASRALGLSYNISMIKIVIPQAIKNILPTLGNEFITLIKETSVVSFITVIDLYTAFNMIGTNTYSVVFPYIVMALIYILLVIVITLLIKIIEKGMAKSDRNN